MLDYCEKTGLDICYDLCHSQLFCNKSSISIIDELKKIEKHTKHFHLSDAGGVDEEGLQFGEGDIPFEKIIPILNQKKEESFAIEVWKGHEQQGKGFEEFLDRVTKAGLIIS